MQGRTYILFYLIIILLYGCFDKTKYTLETKTTAYFEAWNNHDFTNPDFATFKRDTSYTWHGEKKGGGIRSVFNPNSGWKQWDKAWAGSYAFTITEVDLTDLSVTGDFQEKTDFLKIVGMPEGFSARVTFWFDENLLVKETFYDWSEQNKSLDDLLKPIVHWAKENDSMRIQKIYLQDGFVANEQNANEWKVLLENFANRSIDSDSN